MPHRTEATETKSHPPTSIIKIAMSLVEDLKSGEEDEKIADKVRQLIKRADQFDLLKRDPFRVVKGIIRALSHEDFNEIDPTLALLLAQALHTYVDLTVLRMFQDEKYKVFINNKEKYLKKLDTVLTNLINHKGIVQTIELQYPLSCSHAGILALRDSKTWKQETIEVLMFLGKIIGLKDIGSAVTEIFNLLKKRQKEWYVHILELRVLTKSAKNSLQALDQLRQFMAEPDIATEGAWQRKFAEQEALADVVMAGTSYSIQRTAFFGKTPEEKFPCLERTAQRALKPPYYENHAFDYFRVVTALIQLVSSHAEPWLKQAAQKILTNAKRSVDQSFITLAEASRTETHSVRCETPSLPLPSLESKELTNLNLPAQFYTLVNQGNQQVTAGKTNAAAQSYLAAMALLEQLETQAATASRFTKALSGAKDMAKSSLQFVTFGKLFTTTIDPIAFLQKRLALLWTLEFYQALYPILYNDLAKSHSLAAPLYQHLQQHQLPTDHLDKLLKKQAMKTPALTEEKLAWPTASQHGKSIQRWLTESLAQISQLLGDAPCGFSLLLLDIPPFLIGTTTSPLPVIGIIEDDFYRDHPYFQSLTRLVMFSINHSPDRLVTLELQGFETTNKVTTLLARDNPEDYVRFCTANELYCNTPGKRLHDNLQTTFKQQLEAPENKNSESTNKTPDTAAEQKESKRSVTPKVAPDQLAKMLSLGSESFDEKIKTEIKKSSTFKLKKHHHLAKLAYQKQFTYFSTLPRSEAKDAPVAEQHGILPLVAWCRNLALYLNYTDDKGIVLQDVSAILMRAQAEKILAAPFVAELLTLWDEAKNVHQQEVAQRQSKTVTIIQREKLFWHIQHALQPAWQALSQWFESYEAFKQQTTKNKKKLTPLDPVLLNVKQLTHAEPRVITTQLTLLAKTLCARKYTLDQHLCYYHEIPSSFRSEYRAVLAFYLKNTEYAQEILATLARYPEDGVRPAAPFLETTKAWKETIRQELLLASNVEAKKSSPGLKPARLEWYNGDEKFESATLQETIQNQLFDPTDGSLRDHRVKEQKRPTHKLPGQRLVIALTKQPVTSAEQKNATPAAAEVFLYCKFYPQFAGQQFQASAFEKNITGYDSYQAVLGKIYPPHREGETPEGIPVLFTKPAGKDLQQLALADEEQKRQPLATLKLAPRDFATKFFESLLCGHEDNQAANLAAEFFCGSTRLNGIDTDHVFLPALLEEKSFLSLFSTTKVNHKNILYCMDLMNDPIDAQAVREFLALDPIAVIQQVLATASQYENQTIKDAKGQDGGLFSRAELVKLLNAQQKGQLAGKDNCYLPSGFKPGTLYKIFLQFNALQLVLKQYDNKGALPTPLKLLELFDREIAHCYAAVLAKPELSVTERFARVQDMDPSKREDKSAAAQQNSSKVLSAWARPSKFNATKTELSTVTDQKQAPEEVLLTYSKEQRQKALQQEIALAVKHYGSSKQHHYTIYAKVKTELENGNKEMFLAICEHPDASILIEKILRKVDALKMAENLGTPKAKIFQAELLAAIIKAKHRFCELHLNNWTALTPKDLAQLANHSNDMLTLVHVSNCEQLTDSSLETLTRQCANISNLNISGCPKISGKTIRIIATNCKKLEKLDISRTKIRKIREVDLADRTKGPVVFKCLTHLKLDGCRNLELLHVRAEKITKVSFKPYQRAEYTRLLRTVVQKGISALEEPDANGKSPLQQALNDAETMFFLRHLAEEAWERFVAKNQTPLVTYDAVSRYFESKGATDKNVRTVKSLLAPSTHLNDQDSSGCSALMRAAKCGDAEAVELLLGAGADCNLTDSSGSTALVLAAENGHLGAVRWLCLAIKNKIKKHEKTENTEIAADRADKADYGEVVRLMIYCHLPVSDQLIYRYDKHGYDHPFLLRNHLQFFNPYIFDSFKMTPLMRAARYGNQEKVRFLLADGANVDDEDENKKTALMIAAENGHEIIVELLLAAGAIAYKQAKPKQTPLIFAIHGQHIPVIKTLLKEQTIRVATINLARGWGESPLMIAAEAGYTEIVKILLENGADHTQEEGYWHWTAIDYALINSHFEIVKLLETINGRKVRFACHYSPQEKTHDTPAQLALIKGEKEYRRSYSIYPASWIFMLETQQTAPELKQEAKEQPKTGQEQLPQSTTHYAGAFFAPPQPIASNGTPETPAEPAHSAQTDNSLTHTSGPPIAQQTH